MKESIYEYFIDLVHSQDEEQYKINLYKMIQELAEVKEINKIEDTDEIDRYMLSLDIDEQQRRLMNEFQKMNQNQKNRLVEDLLNSNHFHSTDMIVEIIKETFDSQEITEIIENKKEELKELYDRDVVDLIVASGNGEKYLTLEKCKEYGLSSHAITDMIMKLEKEDEYLNSEKWKEYNLETWDITRLICKTKNIEYLTPEFVKKVGLSKNDISKIINDCATKFNNENLHIMYDLGFKHQFLHNSPEIIYDNLEYILEKEGHIDKKSIIERIAKKNAYIACIDYEFLGPRYINILGEDNIGKLSNDMYIVDKLIKSDDEKLQIIKQCLDAGIDRILNKFDTNICLLPTEELQELIPLAENLNKNKFTIPQYYATELSRTQNVKTFCENSDFRFFKSEFTDIYEKLDQQLPEEGSDFFKFATALGCFSTEKMLDKNGKETQVLLAQKATSLLAQLIKKEQMKIRKISWLI